MSFKLHRIYTVKFSFNFLKFSRKLCEISTEMCRKFIKKVVIYLFLRISFLIFLKIFQNFFNFFPSINHVFWLLYFCKIASEFYKNCCRIFPYSKILPKSLESPLYSAQSVHGVNPAVCRTASSFLHKKKKKKNKIFFVENLVLNIFVQ